MMHIRASAPIAEKIAQENTLAKHAQEIDFLGASTNNDFGGIAMNIYEYIKTVIAGRQYNAEDLAYKIDRFWLDSKLTEAERNELIALANDSADNSAQVDFYAKLVDLEHRVVALETADVVVWVAGYTTKKGEVVKYDYDKDGNLDLLRYDGGRSETSLRPGKIDGWHVVDSAGNILGTFHGDTFTPVEA